jgi:hypothetical protein
MPPHAADEVRHKAARSQSEGSLPSLAVVTMVKLRARAMRLKHLTLGADTMEALSLAVEEQSSPAVAAEGQHLLPGGGVDGSSAGIATPPVRSSGVTAEEEIRRVVVTATRLESASLRASLSMSMQASPTLPMRDEDDEDEDEDEDDEEEEERGGGEEETTCSVLSPSLQPSLQPPTLAGEGEAKLFDAFICVGGDPSLPQRIKSAVGWWKGDAALDRLAAGLQPALLTLYPPSTDAAYASLFRQFCLPERFELRKHSGGAQSRPPCQLVPVSVS